MSVHTTEQIAMKKIYHLALHNEWTAITKQGGTYFPPTYDQDGFTHGTGDADKLLEVANHFYIESTGDWVCLEMTEASLNAAGVEVRYEPAAAVGDKDGELEKEMEDDTALFPHLYGGIHPAVVTDIHGVKRDEHGGFTEILFSSHSQNL